MPIVTITRILLALLPLARRLADAMKKGSDGGKKITEEEWLAIVFGSTPRVLRRLGKIADGAEPTEED